MNRLTLASVAVAVMAGAASADYMFPAAYPSGVKMDTVKQIVSFIWDDNAYSGLNMTDYETAPGQSFTDHNWVGGKKPWGAAAPNTLNINEGDMGMAWAISKLSGGISAFPPSAYDPSNANVQAGQKFVYNDTIWEATGWSGANNPPKLHPKYPAVNGDWESIWKYVQPLKEFFASGKTKQNPDGSALQFTFNVISGLFVPIYDNPKGGTGDGYRVSKYGYWQPNDKDLIEFPHLDAYKNATQSLPIAWGREMPVKKSATDKGNVNGEAYGRINDVFKLTNTLGHEIGNHTIDHLESNSMLPNAKGAFPAGTKGEWYLDGFARWGGAGFAADPNSPMKWGDLDSTASEVDEFGRTEGITWHYLGWELYAGKTLPLNAWKGLIEIGEEELDDALGLKPLRKGGTVASFRAPRLEVNGDMHYALKELGYLYDCGQEEGYEYHIDGTNFYWPYTTDNGTPNASWQRVAGENVSLESMPAGLWQYPVNAMIVPKNIREQVWANYEIIARAEGHEMTAQDKDHWIMNDGRVTGFDFNMFVLWGMTKDNAYATLKYNLDQRLAGGKAPMQIGCHTDYFTPIYDNATLKAPENIDTYGLCITNGWNTWEDRKAVFEEFIDYGIQNGVYFWSGRQAIEYTRKISQADRIGTTVTPFAGDWNFFTDELGSTSNTASFANNISGAKISAMAASGEELPAAGYETYFDEGAMKELDHISLSYKSNAPLALVIYCEGDGEREVWLNNINSESKSGNIPLSAFHYNQYYKGAKVALDPAKITGFKIVPLLSGKKAMAVDFSVTDFKLYSGEKVGIGFADQQKKLTVSLASITPNALTLNLPTSGVFTVDMYSLSGKLVSSVKNTMMKAGVNTVGLQSVTPGMYLVSVKGKNVQSTLKAIVR